MQLQIARRGSPCGTVHHTSIALEVIGPITPLEASGPVVIISVGLTVRANHRSPHIVKTFAGTGPLQKAGYAAGQDPWLLVLRNK